MMNVELTHNRQDECGQAMQTVVDMYRNAEINKDEMDYAIRELIRRNRHIVITYGGRLSTNVYKAVGKKRINLINMELGLDLKC